MILKNLSQKTILCSNLKIASTFFDNLFGLLRQSNQGMLFYTRFGIHTFGMTKNIDVLILDKEHKVVKINIGLHHNQLFFWNPKYNIVIELPEGSVNISKTKPGDQLFWAKK
ncbi:MAG: DUF192 domain-containing protein [Candidatus Daviesbacteria bacterium]|nr:DUF192 domain-containing protein [Candidatus Daviesbacteria bacterium]